MEYRLLGRTGRQVSTLRLLGDVADDVNTAPDLGIENE
jgi:hypothetical protein